MGGPLRDPPWGDYHRIQGILPVIDPVKIFIFDIKRYIVGRERLFLEEIGQTVVLLGKAGPGIEIPFKGKNRFPQFGDIVSGEVLAGKCADHVNKGFKCFRLIQNCKGDKQAHSGGVDGGRCDLKIPGELYLPFGV